jgi:hypothetical protein
VRRVLVVIRLVAGFAPLLQSFSWQVRAVIN